MATKPTGKTPKTTRKKDSALACFTLSTQDTTQGMTSASQALALDADRAQALAAISDPNAPDAAPFTDWAASRLEAAGASLDACYGIVHDKDVADPTWDDATQTYTPGGPKKPHLHLVGHFKAGHGLPLKAIAAALGFPENMIEKAKQGRNGYDNLCAYLVHAKDVDKAQYPAARVYTARGRAYMSLYAERRAQWMRGRAIKTSRSDKDLLPQILLDIAEGRLTLDDVYENDEYFRVYTTVRGARSRIEEACAAVDRRRMKQAAKRLNNGEFSKAVFFVSGPPGSGKTSFIRGFLAAIKELTGLDYYNAPAGHSMDDYAGQPILLLDDCYSQAMDFPTFMDLMDPYKACASDARYHTKPAVAPRLIIFAANKTPYHFFLDSALRFSDKTSMPIDALYRRISVYAYIRDPNTYGLYNATIQTVERVDRYRISCHLPMATQPGQALVYEFDYDFTELTEWANVYAVALRFFHEFCHRNPDLDIHEDADATRLVCRCVFDAYKPAMDAGTLPMLPPPSVAYAQTRPIEWPQQSPAHCYSATSRSYRYIEDRQNARRQADEYLLPPPDAPEFYQPTATAITTGATNDTTDMTNGTE